MDLTGKLHDYTDRLRYQGGVKYLRPDVRVVADEVEVGRSADTSGRFLSLTVPDGETEFRVGGAGPHFVMCVHLDAGI
jgi:hypothetical protein